MICKKCKSENVVKSGKDRKGKQIYRCKDCRARFISEIIEVKKKKLGVLCIKCGSDNVVKDGKSEEGRQRYLCKDCGLISVMDKETTSIFGKDKIPVGLTCPTCKSSDLCRSGISTTGKQQYLCKGCGRRFVENSTIKPPLSKEEKRVIVFYHFNFGIKVTDLAKHINRPRTTVSCFLSKYRKRMKEKENDGKIQVHARKRTGRIRNI